MKIACLHASESNIAVFEQSLPPRAAGKMSLFHQVEAQLLAAAEQAGAVTPELLDKTRQVIARLCQQADAVIVTCTTLGIAAADAALFSKPVLRIDAALADSASVASSKLMVLCAAPTTMDSTRQLFQQRQTASQQLIIECVPDAWPLFHAGDTDAYHRHIAAYADQQLALQPDIDCLVLAQSSMSGAAGLIRMPVNILSGAQTSLQAAINLIMA